ncbi:MULTISPECIES: hypothetical protein [Citricoccus]|uniref:hypothetical protein n=1 Tax=Citricoccus TaxID=169133 RepID=UPI000255EFEF|nr:hypothetical protein [Citricoccus sp. CH26A]
MARPTGNTLGRRAALALLAGLVISTGAQVKATPSATGDARFTSVSPEPAGTGRTTLTGTARYAAESTAWGHATVTDRHTGQRTPVALDYGRLYAFGSSTIALSGPRFAAEFRGMPFYNGGHSGELAEETVKRLGSHPAQNAAFRPTHGQRGAILLLNLGKNNLNGAGGTRDVGTLLQWTRDAVAWNGGTNVLVMGHFVNTHTPRSGSALRDGVIAYNVAARAEFGRQFVDLGGFLTSPEVWGYAGISPTPADRQEQATGNKPPSLSRDSAHLNPAAEAALARLVHEHLSELGWVRSRPG